MMLTRAQGRQYTHLSAPCYHKQTGYKIDETSALILYRDEDINVRGICTVRECLNVLKNFSFPDSLVKFKSREKVNLSFRGVIQWPRNGPLRFYYRCAYYGCVVVLYPL